MTASTSTELVPKAAEIATSVIVPARSEPAAAARIDFARIAHDQFFAYGWVLGLNKSVQSASLQIGDTEIDLATQAITIRRPDIAQHFFLDMKDDEHGFYVLVDLPRKVTAHDHVRLCTTLHSGEKAETDWALSEHGTLPASDKEIWVAAIGRLLPLLPKVEAKRLVQFGLNLGLPIAAEHLPALPPPLRFSIEACSVLEERILFVSGWMSDPLKELTQARLRVGDSRFELLDRAIRIPRPDIAPDTLFSRKRDPVRDLGFILVQPIEALEADDCNARFTFSTGTDTVQLTRPLSHSDVRREVLSLLSTMDPQSVLALIERLADVINETTELKSLAALFELVAQGAIERLPTSIQHANPRFALYLDQVIPVADKGIFVIGWFNADPDVSARVICHCGSAKFEISKHWLRHFRTDVTSYLAGQGIHPVEHLHGFSCYVPLSNGKEPYYLSVESDSGQVSRMSVAVPARTASAIQTVRSLLTFFSADQGDVRALMDTQVGPAVSAAWAARRKPSQTLFTSSYGAGSADPAVSLIVPLYGRHDFAEYQMALFADDPEFQNLELIYVVDDPTMFFEFRSLCPHLYGIYQVPFILKFAGANLGFAGANNFGAETARGKHLLLLNSDVLPKRRGWVGQLLRAYRSVQNPGLVGAKLLYEDGSVQHAGMAFRKYAGWGDFWINDHPQKGQSPLGLNGIREVESVTAACALIDASLYRELGGLSEDYIIGDFEDSDLCLRARSLGRRNHVALDVELYHLERQSQNRMNDVTWRTNLTLYNCWLHNRRWAGVIERMHNGSVQNVQSGAGKTNE